MAETFSGENEEDEVIREIDVYISDNLELYLAQFPLTPVYAEPLDINQARIKPKHGIVELISPIDPKLVKVMRQNGSEMTHQRFQSNEVPQNNNLSMGFITTQNSMVLSPVRKVLQFRPMMDKSKGILRADSQVDIGQEGDTEPVADDTDGAGSDSMHQVLLQRKETERAQAARLQSYSYIKKQEESEPWIDLAVHSISENLVSSIFFVYF